MRKSVYIETSIPSYLTARPSRDVRVAAWQQLTSQAEADALHIAISAVHRIDYLLTWNCRHIDNATRKPMLRAICEKAGYCCPEICTPMELLPENDDVSR
ncbi:PIN domain-containing protein [Thiorhodovibrio frisius]|uniref:hypothetical protein n=1 Tax=Thiorhodovibrio frisius TaxID=631362 RepID=UPI000A05D310|nr:hypothetical protein [Thiorhodovibrio frisius]